MDKFLNVSGENAELLLHGIVGKEINGTEIANKLKALKDLGVKHVKQRINSVGGSIISGYSIVAANLDLTENGIIVETINEGVADSMSSVILASGTRGHRKAKDYSTSVIHNPLFNGTSLNDMKDDSIKAMLTSFKNSLLAIYAAALGKTKEELSDTMNEERMLNADQMKAIGLVDEVIPTNINKPEIKNLSLAEIMNVYEAIENPNTNKKKRKMSKLNEFYALSNEASDESLLEAAKAERQKLTETTEKVQNLELELEAKKTELKTFQDEAIKSAVKNAIESGKFDKDDEKQLIENAVKIGLESFNLMVGKIKIPHVDVVGMINNKTGDNKKAGEHQKLVDGKVIDKVYEDYNALEIEKLQNLNPEKFEAIVNEFNERD